MLLDLDRFKRINDEHGHETGDQVLVRVAETLRSLRATEIPARWGGEEFVVVLPATGVADAVVSMDRVRRRMRATIRVEGAPVTFSAGVASLRFAADLERAMAAADAALYRAKASGRDRIEAAQTATALVARYAPAAHRVVRAAEEPT